jgi:hypothetical protein
VDLERDYLEQHALNSVLCALARLSRSTSLPFTQYAAKERATESSAISLGPCAATSFSEYRVAWPTVFVGLQIFGALATLEK